MAKISALDLIADEDVDGTEQVPMVKNGAMRRAKSSAVLTPHLALIDSARDAAIAAANPQADEASGLAATPDGGLFSFFDAAADEVKLVRNNAGSAQELDIYFGASRLGIAGGGSAQDAFNARPPGVATLAEAKVANLTGAPKVDIVDRVNSTWRPWFEGMTLPLPAHLEDYAWFTHADGTKYWLDHNGVITPQMCGAIGNAKAYDAATGKWVLPDVAGGDPMPADDTKAVQAAYDWAAVSNGRVLKTAWYGIYPLTSGHDPITIENARPLASGSILPLVRYIVEAPGGGHVTYDGVDIYDGEEFDGKTYTRSFTTTGDAKVFFRMTFGVLVDYRTPTAGPNYDRYLDIDCLLNAGLVLCEAGCAEGCIGVWLGDGAPDSSYVHNTRIRSNVDMLDILEGQNTMGFFLQSLSFRAEISGCVNRCAWGGVILDCFNADLGRLDYWGYALGYGGFVIGNANSQGLRHIFTHHTKMAGWIEFASPHGMAGGESVVMSFDGSKQFWGTVAKVIDDRTVAFDEIMWAFTTAMTGWTASIDGAPAVKIVDARSEYGVGLMTWNCDGFDAYCDFQNRGGYGWLHLIDRGQGDNSMSGRGHIEGPSTGIRVFRSDALTGTESLSAIHWRGSIFGGRTETPSDFGRCHAVELAHVGVGDIGGWFHAREHMVLQGQAVLYTPSTEWAAGAFAAQPWGIYECIVGGLGGDRGPVGTDAYIADNEAVWKFVRRINNTVLIDVSCGGVSLKESYHDLNTIYNGPLNLQSVKHRAFGGKRDFGESQGPLLMSRSNVTAPDAAPILYRPASYYAALDDERRQPTAIIAEVKLTANTIAPSSAGRYFRLELSYPGQNAANVVKCTLTPTRALEEGTVTWIVRIPLSQYREFTAQFKNGGAGGSWAVSGEIRALGFEY